MHAQEEEGNCLLANVSCLAGQGGAGAIGSAGSVSCRMLAYVTSLSGPSRRRLSTQANYSRH